MPDSPLIMICTVVHTVHVKVHVYNIQTYMQNANTQDPVSTPTGVIETGTVSQ